MTTADRTGTDRTGTDPTGDADGGSADRLVWLDLEMTGLDTSRHVIVEIAALVTDGDLRPLDDGIDLVVHASEADLAEMDRHVTNMHTRSGLLPEIRAATRTLAEAGAETLAYVRRHVPTAGSAPVCGNSIGVDRRFLDRHLPDLDGYLHYRSIDVSTLKELCRRWAPAAYAARPKKAESHRALADVHESIAELAYYRDAFLRLPDAP